VDSADFYSTTIAPVRGWFFREDYEVFKVIAECFASATAKPRALEVGSFFGKSTLALAKNYGSANVDVVDLFGETPSQTSEVVHISKSNYEGLTLDGFCATFQTAGIEVPNIHVGDSQLVATLDGGWSFVHHDGSHTYATVRSDLITICETVNADGGIIAIDDFRSEHTPGVGAASWEILRQFDAIPFAVTPMKLYAAIGSEVALEASMRLGSANLHVDSEHLWDEQVPVLRIAAQKRLGPKGNPQRRAPTRARHRVGPRRRESAAAPRPGGAKPGWAEIRPPNCRVSVRGGVRCSRRRPSRQ
jgi:hypothetical protein